MENMSLTFEPGTVTISLDHVARAADKYHKMAQKYTGADAAYFNGMQTVFSNILLRYQLRAREAAAQTNR